MTVTSDAPTTPPTQLSDPPPATAPPGPGDSWAPLAPPAPDLRPQLRAIAALLALLVVLVGANFAWTVNRQHQIHQCVQSNVSSVDDSIGVGSSTYCLAN